MVGLALAAVMVCSPVFSVKADTEDEIEAAEQKADELEKPERGGGVRKSRALGTAGYDHCGNERYAGKAACEGRRGRAG